MGENLSKHERRERGYKFSNHGKVKFKFSSATTEAARRFDDLPYLVL